MAEAFRGTWWRASNAEKDLLVQLVATPPITATDSRIPVYVSSLRAYLIGEA